MGRNNEQLGRGEPAPPGWRAGGRFLRLHPGTIGSLLVLLLSVALGPVLLLQGIEHYRTMRAQRALELESNREIARAAAVALDGFIRDIERHERMIGVAITSGLGAAAGEREIGAFLRQQAAADPPLAGYYWTDARGQVIAAGDPRARGLQLGDRPYFQALAAGRPWVLSDLLIDRGTGRPAFVVATAIRRPDGRLWGAVVGAIRPDRLGSLAPRRGNEGAVSIFDHTGRLVYRYPPRPLSWGERLAAGRQIGMAQALQGHTYAGAWQSSFGGGRRLGAAVPISSLGWVATASRAESASLGPARRAAHLQFALAAAVCLLAGLLAWVIGRQLTVPMRRLQAHALAFGRGELDRPVEVKGLAQVEELAGAFNRMAAELARRQREQATFQDRLQAIMENSATHLAYLDRDMVIREVNSVYARGAGYPKEELVGRPHFELFPDPENERIFKEVLETGQPVSFTAKPFEFPGQPERGVTYWDWTLSPVMADGEVHGLVLALQDVTERIRAGRERERLLEEVAAQRQLFELVAANAPVGIALLDPQMRFRWANQAFQRFLDEPFQEAELTGRPLRAVLPDPDAVIATCQRVRLTGQPFTAAELPYDGFARGRTYWQWSLLPLPVPGQAAPDLLLVAHDITDQVLARHQVEVLAAQREKDIALLQAERAFLSSAIELLPFPIFFVDTAGVVTRSNQAFRQLVPDSNGQSWWEIELLDPYTHSAVPQASRPLERALGGEVVPAGTWTARLTDGRELPVLIQAAPVFADGRVVAGVGSLQDISALKAADRAKDEFLAVLSHELLTPLTSILGWSQLLMGQGRPELVPQGLEVIRRNAERQKRLVDDLLDVSRIIHGRLPLRPETTDLWRAAEHALQNVEHLAAERQVSMTATAPAALLPVQADPIRLVQAVDNLLVNALKFSSAGGRVTVRGWQVDGWAKLAVEDHGRGIPAEDLAHIFEPFRQVQRDEAAGGLGLGLALVRGITELHGGRVTAESPGPGQGSTFTIELPLARAGGQQPGSFMQ